MLNLLGLAKENFSALKIKIFSSRMSIISSVLKIIVPYSVAKESRLLNMPYRIQLAKAGFRSSFSVQSCEHVTGI